jgi:hypothetical protein
VAHVEQPKIEQRQGHRRGLRIAVSTDALGDQAVLGLIVQGEFALLHERLNARRPARTSPRPSSPRWTTTGLAEPA